MTGTWLAFKRLALIAGLAAAGVVSAGYVLLHERLAPPLQSTYDVQVDVSAANGIVPGLGQPVEVAGVNVGTITAASVQSGMAVVSLQIDRSQLSRIYANASATLAPITPLQDMQLLLDPGGPPAPVLPSGGTIPIGHTRSPVPLSDLLDALNGDTRDWMASTIASLGQGTRGQGANLRRALLTLAPTTQELKAITTELAARRQALAGLVHNLAIVAHAASRDRQLASVVVAGDQTLRTIASQDAPLGSALAKLPGTLTDARLTLNHTAAFSNLLGPTIAALQPAVQRLPATLAALKPFAERLDSTLALDIRPLIRRGEPVISALGPATIGLTRVVPSLTSVAQVLEYTVNELAYNPGGNDQGFLYWLPWWGEDVSSAVSTGDAHGTFLRAMLMVNCQDLLAQGALGEVVKLLTGAANVCPG